MKNIKIILFISIFIATNIIINEILILYKYKKIFIEKRNLALANNFNSKDFINNSLMKLGVYYNDELWFINKFTISIMSVFIGIITYLLFKNLLKLKLLTIIFSITIAVIPIYFLKLIEDEMDNKIEKELINFIVKLKSQMAIHNDLIKAVFDITKYLENPIKIYLKRFCFEIEKGLNIEHAFNNLKSRINNKEYYNLISNIENCYNYGGDVTQLLERSQEVFSSRQKERKNRSEQTFSGRVVLIILIFLMLFVYFNFIRNDEQNFKIMINDFIGKLILYWNFISIWLLMFLVNLVKRMDE